MHRVKAQAQALMKLPTEDGITTAGATFEYVPQSNHPLAFVDIFPAASSAQSVMNSSASGSRSRWRT